MRVVDKRITFIHNSEECKIWKNRETFWNYHRLDSSLYNLILQKLGITEDDSSYGLYPNRSYYFIRVLRLEFCKNCWRNRI